MLKKYFSWMIDTNVTNYWLSFSILLFVISLVIHFADLAISIAFIPFSFSLLTGVATASSWWSERKNFSWVSKIGWVIFLIWFLVLSDFFLFQAYTYFFSHIRLIVMIVSFYYIGLAILFVWIKTLITKTTEPKSKIAKYFYFSLKNISEEKKEIQ